MFDGVNEMFDGHGVLLGEAGELGSVVVELSLSDGRES